MNQPRAHDGPGPELASTPSSSRAQTDMPANDRPIEAPRPTPDAAPFWEAANEGRLLIKHCAECDRMHYPPRPFCPHCFSAGARWHECTGQGTLYAYSVVRRTEIPYAMAYVRLAEGPIMMTNIVDTPFSALRADMDVQVVFKASVSGQLIPMFKAASPIPQPGDTA